MTIEIFEPIEFALKKLLDKSVTVTNNGANFQVRAVVTAPEEQFKQAKYPIPDIGIWQFDTVHTPEREIDKIWRDTPRDAQTNTRKPAPIKYDVTYQISTQSFFAQHDRQLTREIMTKLPPRGWIEVGDLDSVGQITPIYRLWCFFEDFRSQDTWGQYRVFKKYLTYKVLTWMDYPATSEQIKKLAYAGAEIQVGIAHPTEDRLIAL